MKLWSIQHWMQLQMSHVSMSFYVLGNAISLLVLIGLKMYGVGNMNSVFWALFTVSLLAALGRAIRQVYHIRLYFDGETVYGLLGRL